MVLIKKSKILGSLVLASALASVASADVDVFGQVGAFGNAGFGSGNIGANAEKINYSGLVGQIGVDFSSNNMHYGIGIYGALSPYSTPGGFNGGYGRGMYSAKYYAELSDLYIKYDSESFKFVVGKYNASQVLNTSDWIGGYNQGLALNYQTGSFGVWATWINDWMNTGFNSSADFDSKFGRFGTGLSAFNSYATTVGNGGIGKRDLFSGGFDFDFGDIISINPYASYWFGQGGFGNQDLAQAGIRGTLKLGDESGFQSITTLRGLWQNTIGVDNDYGMLGWADQEFLIKDTFKLGGGFLSVGHKYIRSLNDRTRFYGQFFTPNTQSYNTLSRGYLAANVQTWYVFTGFKVEDKLDVDILYAGGNYNEFSAVFNYQIIANGDDLNWSAGAGFVTNGFGHGINQKYNLIAFTKLQF